MKKGKMSKRAITEDYWERCRRGFLPIESEEGVASAASRKRASQSEKRGEIGASQEQLQEEESVEKLGVPCKGTNSADSRERGGREGARSARTARTMSRLRESEAGFCDRRRGKTRGWRRGRKAIRIRPQEEELLFPPPREKGGHGGEECNVDSSIQNLNWWKGEPYLNRFQEGEPVLTNQQIREKPLLKMKRQGEGGAISA